MLFAVGVIDDDMSIKWSTVVQNVVWCVTLEIITVAKLLGQWGLNGKMTRLVHHCPPLSPPKLSGPGVPERC